MYYVVIKLMGRDGRVMIPGFGIWPVPVSCQIPDQTISEFKLCKTKVTRQMLWRVVHFRLSTDLIGCIRTADI